jgi:hypothetical protein
MCSLILRDATEEAAPQDEGCGGTGRNFRVEAIPILHVFGIEDDDALTRRPCKKIAREKSRATFCLNSTLVGAISSQRAG